MLIVVGLSLAAVLSVVIPVGTSPKEPNWLLVTLVPAGLLGLAGLYLYFWIVVLELFIKMGPLYYMDGNMYGAQVNSSIPPPPVPMSAQDQLDKHESSARAFILKMLIMTPINILKGLCELLDPHIGITKMIKRITGYAFDELAEVMEAPATGINTARKQMIANDPLQGEESEAYKNFRGINGDDLLKFILCLLQLSMESVGDALEDNTSIPPNFFPDIERDGIDFTGKVSGLLMVPPTPLGLIYLLLGLIKTGEEGTVDALAAPVEEEGCAPPEDPSVDLEAEENPCEPDEIP